LRFRPTGTIVARTSCSLSSKPSSPSPSFASCCSPPRDRILAEDSSYDSVWRCRDPARGYTGQNLLGRALMRIRDELHAADAARGIMSSTLPGCTRLLRAARRGARWVGDERGRGVGRWGVWVAELRATRKKIYADARADGQTPRRRPAGSSSDTSDVIHRRMVRDLAPLPAQPLLAARPLAAARSQGWPDRAEQSEPRSGTPPDGDRQPRGTISQEGA
jgi:hypothetical protein